jgi:hypothetical protein
MGAEDIFYSQLYKKSCQIKAALQEAMQTKARALEIFSNHSRIVKMYSPLTSSIVLQWQAS